MLQNNSALSVWCLSGLLWFVVTDGRFDTEECGPALARSGLTSKSTPWHSPGSLRFLQPLTAGCRHGRKVKRNIFEGRDKQP